MKNINLTFKLPDALKKKLKDKLDKNYFSYQFSKNKKLIQHSLEEFDEHFLSESDEDKELCVSPKFEPKSRISLDLKSHLMQGVNSLNISSGKIYKNINDKFRLQYKLQNEYMTDRIISENNDMKNYYEKNYKREVNNGKLNYKKFMYSYMDERNSVINNSFKNDLDSFMDKTKKNRNNNKDRKNKHNFNNIVKNSNKSYNLELDSYNLNGSKDNDKEKEKNSIIKSKSKINIDDESLHHTPKFSKSKGNDSKRLKLFQEPKSISKNIIMKSVYYNEFKNEMLSSDPNRYKPVKKEAINSFKNVVNTHQLLKFDSMAISENTSVDKKENINNITPDLKIKTENEVEIKRKNKLDRRKREELIQNEIINSKKRKLDYNFVGNENYGFNTQLLLKTEYYDSIYYTDNKNYLKDYRFNPLVLD